MINLGFLSDWTNVRLLWSSIYVWSSRRNHNYEFLLKVDCDVWYRSHLDCALVWKQTILFMWFGRPIINKSLLLLQNEQHALILMEHLIYYLERKPHIIWLPIEPDSRVPEWDLLQGLENSRLPNYIAMLFTECMIRLYCWISTNYSVSFQMQGEELQLDFRRVCLSIFYTIN